jgi:ribonuclease D
VIHTQAQLAELVFSLDDAERIGLDTEADSLHAYPEKLCLIQLSYGDSHVLVDPLAGLDLTVLTALLQRKPIILHGADYDLRMLFRAFKFVAGKIFDTMWAARLLGYKEFGLRHLVQQHLGVQLEKGPQKMNWGIRPLPARMAAYALNDTRHLQPLADILTAELQAKGRLAWHQEVCARVTQETAQISEPIEDDLWRIKGSDRLDRPAMAVLREIWLWREEEALSTNRPPYFILSHEKLVAVAAAVAQGKPAQNLVPHSMPSKRAARLAAAIDRGLKTPASHHPERRRTRGQYLTAAQQNEFDRLKRVREQRAGELGVDSTVIASKAELIELARGLKNHQHPLMEWQRALLFP